LAEILKPYTDGKTDLQYVFPIIKRTRLVDQEKDVQWARKRYNKRLKELASKAGIEANLTSYVSRHSYASRAKTLGISHNIISEMLGHKSTKTTDVYLADLESEVMDEYHSKVVDLG